MLNLEEIDMRERGETGVLFLCLDPKLRRRLRVRWLNWPAGHSRSEQVSL